MNHQCEVQEILPKEQFSGTDTRSILDAKAAEAEEPQRREEAPISTTATGKARDITRRLWDETATRLRLGEDGYAWFMETAERNLPKCSHCKGSGKVMVPDPTGIRR